MARRKRRRRALTALGAVSALVAGTAYGAWRYIDENEYLLDERCEVSIGGTEHRLSPEQAHNAATIAAAAVDRGLPPEAAVHTIGIALQESDLVVRESEDERDARVLFARGTPSWSDGPNAQSVAISLEGFYDVLESSWQEALETDQDEENDDDVASEEEESSKPPAWDPSMDLEEAAEALGRPQDPSFYPRHYERARAFALPLAGQEQATMFCRLSQDETKVPAPNPEGVSDEIAAMLPHALQMPFTEPEEGEESEEESSESEEFAPEPITDGIITVEGEGSEAVMTIAVPERDGEYDYLWMLGHWSVATAYDYGIESVLAGPYRWERDSGLWVRGQGHSDDAVVLRFGPDED